MNNKKLLLLGGSAQQIIAIEKAKTLGYYTILCDYLQDNPGQYVADKYYNVSTTDIDAVYEIAIKEKVNGVLAYASDPAALPAAIVCNRLGLPSNPTESVRILGLKHPWREFLRKNGFACPQSVSFSPDVSLEEFKELVKDFTWPLVIKPTDSSGRKGVSILKDFSIFNIAIQSANIYSRNKILIAEEFIVHSFPHVIGGDIFVWNKKIVFYGEMSCLRDETVNGLIPVGEKKPSGLNERQRKNIYRELQRLVSDLNINFGEFNIEILLDNNDGVHFLELGPRAGGNMIPVQLSDAWGIDLVEANIKACMGEVPNLVLNEQKGCFFTYVLHSYEEGLFDGIIISDEIMPYIYRKVIYKKIGDKIEYFDGAGKAIGILFVHVDTEEQMNDFCQRLDTLIKIKLA